MPIDFSGGGTPVKDSPALDFSGGGVLADGHHDAPDFSAGGEALPDFGAGGDEVPDDNGVGYVSDKIRRIGEGAAEGAIGAAAAVPEIVQGFVRPEGETREQAQGVWARKAKQLRGELEAFDQQWKGKALGSFADDPAGSLLRERGRIAGAMVDAEQKAARPEELLPPTSMLRKLGKVADFAGDQAATLRELKNAQKEVYGPNQKYDDSIISDIASGIGSSLPAMVATMATGGAALPAYGTAALQMYQENFDSALQAGQSLETAHASGMAAMPLAYFEKFGDIKLGNQLRKNVEGAFERTARRRAMELVKEKGLEIGGGALGESMTEMIQTAGQQVIENEMMGYKHDDAATRLKEVGRAGVAAFGSGGAISMVGAGVEVAGNLRKKDGNLTAKNAENTKREEAKGVNEFGGEVLADGHQVNGTVPETPETIGAQLELVRSGKKNVMLVTPGATLPPIPAELKSYTTPAGTFIYRDSISEDTIDAALKGNTVGQLLGYGVNGKPVGTAAAVVVRDAQGGEVQAVLADGSRAPDALAAAKRVAPAGGTVTIEAPGQVVGDRVANGPSTIADKQTYPVVEVPLAELSLSDDVPNFKADADPTSGVVEGQQLEGSYERLGTGAITVWERADGRKEVISGRHRFDLAKRAGEQSIPAQIVREADGFTAQMATVLDAEMNIRDGQGAVADYANYFRNTPITQAEAKAKGLLSRGKGAAGWALGKMASGDVYALWRAGKISESQAVAIATAAAGNESLQRVGTKSALNGASAQEIRNFIQAVGLKTRGMSAEQFDLFGADDTAISEAERLAKIATQAQRELADEIKATQNAASNPELAQARGIEFQRSPEELRADNARLAQEWGRWNNWALHSDLVAEVMDRDQAARSKRVDELEGKGKRTRMEERELAKLKAEMPAAVLSIEQRLDRLKVEMSPKQLHLFGLIPATWNAAIDVAKLAVRAGRTVAQAIDAAVDWLKGQGHAFDEAGVRGALTSQLSGDPTRQYGEKVLFGPLDERVKEGVTEYTYTPRSNEGDRDTAARIIEERGLDNAIASYKDASNDMPGAVRSILGDVLLERMAMEQRAAEAAGERIRSDELIEKQVDLVNHELRRSTEIAQSLQAMRRFGLMTPAAMMRMAVKIFNDAGVKIFEAVKPTVDAIRKELVDGNEDALNETVQNPEVNRAAAEAVDEAIVASPETRDALVVEIAGGVGQSPEVMRQLREMVRGLFNHRGTEPQSGSLWGKYAGGAARSLLTAIENAFSAKASGGRASLDQFTATLRGVLRDQIDAVLGDRSAEAGSPRSKLLQLADLLNNPEKVQEVWERVVKNIPEDLRASAKVQELIKNPPALFSAKLLEGVVGEQLRAMDVGMADLVAGHYRGEDVARPLRDKIMAALGLDATKATALAAAIDKQWKAQMDAAMAKVATRLKALRQVRDDRMARILKSGLVEPEQVPDGELDRVLRRQMRELNIRLGKVVREALNKQNAAREAIGLRVVGAAGLSGPKAARLREIFSQKFEQFARAAKRKRLEQLGQTVRPPMKMRGAYEKLIELTNLGAFSNEEFYNIVREKYGLPTWTPEIGREVTRRANDIVKQPDGFQRQRGVIGLMNYIESAKGMAWHELPMAFWYANVLSGPLTHLKNIIGNVYNLSAFTGLQLLRNPMNAGVIAEGLARGITKGALEGVAVLQTGIVTGSRMEKIEASKAIERLPKALAAWKLVGRALAAEDMLFFKSAEEMRSGVAARMIAKREGLSGSALSRRVGEILGNLEARVAAAQSQAHAEGLTGLDFRRRTNELIEQQRPAEMRETARQYALRATFNQKPDGVLGIAAQYINAASEKIPALRLVVPFTNVVANVVNESLHYFPPVGGYRAIRGAWAGEMMGRAVEPGEVFDTAAKATVGFLALTAVAAAAALHWDDPDPEFMLYGAGPLTSDQKRQLMETGWRPYSVKVGKRYYNYQQTPAAIPLAILGNYLDAVRWRKLGDASALERTAVAGTIAGRVITDQSWLDGLAGLFQALDREPSKGAGDVTIKQGVRTAAGFVIPNAVRQIDQLFDPGLYDDSTISGMLAGQVPFVRRLNKPVLNGMGEPVTQPRLTQFVSPRKTDDLWQVIAEKQAWLPAVEREVIVGDKKRGPDYYRVLDADERYELVHAIGQGVRDSLDVDKLRDLEPDQAKAYVQKVAAEQRKRALRAFPR